MDSSEITSVLQVDYREAAIIPFLEPGTFETKNLVLGDFTVGGLVIERKSISDLSASISDGRFREQKSRLEESYAPDHTLYIIEGNIDKECRVPKATLLSAIENLVLNHSFKVLYTQGPKDTAELLSRIVKKKLEYTPRTLVESRAVKKSTVSKNNALAFQLATIPGVSLKTAQDLQEKYKSMKILVDVPVKELEVFVLGSGRKLGPKCAAKIVASIGS